MECRIMRPLIRTCTVCKDKIDILKPGRPISYFLLLTSNFDVCMLARTCPCMRAYMRTYTHVCPSVCLYVCVCVSKWGLNWNTLRMLWNMSDYIGTGILEVCECPESVADRWSRLWRVLWAIFVLEATLILRLAFKKSFFSNIQDVRNGSHFVIILKIRFHPKPYVGVLKLCNRHGDSELLNLFCSVIQDSRH